MAEAYKSFGSFILFKELLADELGHLYRAAEFSKQGISRTAFVRVFDGANVPQKELIGSFDAARKIAEVLKAANVVGKPVFTAAKGVPLMAHDFVPAQPLSRVFEKVHEEGFPVPVDNALLIMEKLSLALSAGLAVEVKGSSLVHGFLHPGLVLVTNDGEGLVAGFGCGGQLLGILDDPGSLQEVAPYLAPEVLVSRTPGKRSDVYSLGAILFQLLSGQPLPADPDQRTGVLDSAELAYDDRPIPDDIKRLLARALASRPEDRHSSAADFKKDLDKLLYGGTYSPTTFNLALFMDRLFRAEIETEEKEREAEAKVDFSQYLEPEPAPAPEPEAVEAPAPTTAKGANKGLMIGLAAAAVVVVAIVGFFALGGREPAAPLPTPTPDAAQEAAARAAQEERLKELAAQMFEERMKEREEELRSEMLDRQKKIEDLERQLKETEKKTSLSADEKRRKEELQRQIAAEQEAKRKKEAEAEAERQRMLEEAQRQAEAQQAAATATAVAVAEAAAAKPTAVPTKVAQAQAPAGGSSQEASSEVVITENSFVDPSQVDTMPVVIKDEPVTWSRTALHSRRKGMVILQATVNAKGTVEEVKVLRADEEGFGIPQAVIEAVRKYTFKPATKNGVKVKSYATVTKRYNFRSR